MIRRISMLASTVAVGCLAALALNGCGRAGAAGGMTMPPPVVTTALVGTADVPDYLEEIGKTTATEAVNIIPQDSGQIVQRYFEDGTDLKKGQKLFLIERRPFVAILDQTEAALQQTQAQLANAETNFDRVASELPSKAVSQQDYDNAKNAVEVGKANVKAAEAGIETAKWNLDNTLITSPIDGRAGQRLVDAGNVITANTTLLLSIQKITPIYVDFTVAENELDRVRENLAKGPLKVIVEAPDEPEKSVTGEVTFLDNSVQDGTGTIKLRASVPNGNRQLWPGQFVHVRLILSMLKDAALIPTEAVQVGQAGSYVYVIHPDTTAEQRNITTGQRQGDEIVVLDGLKAGEVVVKTGQLMVVPAKPVTIIPSGPAGGARPGAGAGAGAGAAQ